MRHLMTKPTKLHVCPAKTQISLGIHTVGSEYSLCAQWVARDPSFLHADSEKLSLRWTHMPFLWFCHKVAHYFRKYIRKCMRKKKKKKKKKRLLQKPLGNLYTWLLLDIFHTFFYNAIPLTLRRRKAWGDEVKLYKLQPIYTSKY